MKSSSRKVVLYIVYGEDQVFYDGAIFSFLTFRNWISDNNQIEVFVLTEKPFARKCFWWKMLSVEKKIGQIGQNHCFSRFLRFWRFWRFLEILDSKMQVSGMTKSGKKWQKS